MIKINKFLWGILSLCLCFCVACSDDDSDYTTSPVVTDFSPKEGDAGVQVTITGQNFGSDGSVYFNGIEAAELVSYTDNQIVAVVPQGNVSGSITVKCGDVRVRTSEHFSYKSSNPEDNYESGTFRSTLTCRDVVYFTGKANPCDYSSDDASSGNLGQMGKDANYKGSSDAKSFALWDSAPGDMTIFKVDITDIGRYYLSCASGTTQDGVSVNVTVDKDLEALKDASSPNAVNTQGVVNNGSWSNFSNTLEFGGYVLAEPGTYYIRVLMLKESGSGGTVCLKFLDFFN